jgi:hypothetical protein
MNIIPKTFTSLPHSTFKQPIETSQDIYSLKAIVPSPSLSNLFKSLDASLKYAPYPFLIKSAWRFGNSVESSVPELSLSVWKKGIVKKGEMEINAERK